MGWLIYEDCECTGLTSVKRTQNCVFMFYKLRRCRTSEWFPPHHLLLVRVPYTTFSFVPLKQLPILNFFTCHQPCERFWLILVVSVLEMRRWWSFVMRGAWLLLARCEEKGLKTGTGIGALAGWHWSRKGLGLGRSCVAGRQTETLWGHLWAQVMAWAGGRSVMKLVLPAGRSLFPKQTD